MISMPARRRSSRQSFSKRPCSFVIFEETAFFAFMDLLSWSGFLFCFLADKKKKRLSRSSRLSQRIMARLSFWRKKIRGTLTSWNRAQLKRVPRSQAQRKRLKTFSSFIWKNCMPRKPGMQGIAIRDIINRNALKKIIIMVSFQTCSIS